MHLTFIDVVFTVIVFVFAIMATTHGFLKELFGKLAIIAGIVVAVLFSSKLSPHMEKFINNQAVCIVLAFILLFIAAFLLVKIIQTLIGSVMDGDILKSLDRVLGFVLGALEGLFIVCAILILVCAQPWFELSVVTDGSFYYKVLAKFIQGPVNYLKGIFV